MNNKVGMEKEQLVLLIVVLLIFLTMLFWATNLYGISSPSKEACHQSVVMRSMPGIGEIEKRTYPLNCKTEDLVINSGKEDDVKKELANRMYDCWWMLGEGKANFFLRPLGLTETKCLICYNIKFGDKARRLGTISGFSDYLSNTKTPTGKTYMELFGVNNVVKDTAEQPIDLTKDYLVIFSMTEKSHFIGTGTGTAGCVASALGGAKLGGAAAGLTTATIVGAPLAPAVGTIVGGATFVIGCGASIWAAMGIDKLTTKDEVYIPAVHLVPYNSESITPIRCSSIESIP